MEEVEKEIFQRLKTGILDLIRYHETDELIILANTTIKQCLGHEKLKLFEYSKQGHGIPIHVLVKKQREDVIDFFKSKFLHTFKKNKVEHEFRKLLKCMWDGLIFEFLSSKGFALKKARKNVRSFLIDKWKGDINFNTNDGDELFSPTFALETMWKENEEPSCIESLPSMSLKTSLHEKMTELCNKENDTKEKELIVRRMPTHENLLAFLRSQHDIRKTENDLRNNILSALLRKHDIADHHYKQSLQVQAECQEQLKAFRVVLCGAKIQNHLLCKMMTKQIAENDRLKTGLHTLKNKTDEIVDRNLALQKHVLKVVRCQESLMMDKEHLFSLLGKKSKLIDTLHILLKHKDEKLLVTMNRMLMTMENERHHHKKQALLKHEKFQLIVIEKIKQQLFYSSEKLLNMSMAKALNFTMNEFHSKKLKMKKRKKKSKNPPRKKNQKLSINDKSVSTNKTKRSKSKKSKSQSKDAKLHTKSKDSRSLSKVSSRKTKSSRESTLKSTRKVKKMKKLN